MLQKLREKLHKYKRWEALAFFTAGFVFDALLLHRIDNPLMLAHQALYLCLAAAIIAWDLFCEEGMATIPSWLSKAWTYREGALHFILGTLLNVYTIFYFKSGSLMSSIYFLVFIGSLLYLNETRPLRISKQLLRNALFGLCLICYMNIIVSIAVGSVGAWVFILAILVAYLLHSLFIYALRSRVPRVRIFKEIRLPFFAIALIYSLLYGFKVLPPVPLSVTHIGIYRSVEKSNGQYILGQEESSWKFWRLGDEKFKARPGDTIYSFVQVFSPARFKDQLYVRWQHKDPKTGWQSWDAIPFEIVGGREDGYRGFTSKSNYTEGDWRVSIETLDGREVGRLDFEVVMSDDASPPELHFETR